MKLSTVVALSGLLAVSEAVPQQKLLQRQSDKKPNFLFVMTDDQDLQLNSTAYTPQILSRIKEKGTDFANHFVTTSLCCPSRVSLWTGRQAHNTNVTDVRPPWGGYPKFVAQGFNDDWFPVWFQNAGYNTYYTGKLMNAQSLSTYNKPFAKGFNGSDFLLDPHTYSYYNATYQRNHEPPKSYAGQHTTDVIADKSLGFLNDALESDRPFFLAVSPVAPHSNIEPGSMSSSDPTRMTEPIPLPRHQHLFQDVKLPRTPNFNPLNNTGASWVSKLALQNQSVVDAGDHFYRQRLRALQGVDELVDALITRLEESDEIDNTYIIFTSDNGFHIGQHRMPPGKTTGYEEDIRVPFFIRGPGIPEGQTVTSVSTHIDLVPTFFELAGVPLRDDFDGTPMPIKRKSAAVSHEHVTVEFWGSAVLEGDFAAIGVDGQTKLGNNTYKSARILGEGYNLYYSVWCNGDHELYDLTSDPYQTHNIYTPANTTTHLLGRPLHDVINRLDALLLVLQSCKGTTCIQPWKVIHPDESVQSLRDALTSQYDAFYQRQPKVSYEQCLDGYLISNEGPQVGLQYRDGLSWSAWV
ncbi:alkaline-phosphatase-like protein [Aspergillus avenaceus]|uniref:Arylsulfatase n=1 Tax=Aspergillus avenaceus TaxID=36643 RepID=A0A5N6TS33_ASPAV|nr:alkaline-phosphatase-like protein [Aspergillus avenaceus]